jgi:carbamoyl-phosphate synthase large subunit
MFSNVLLLSAGRRALLVEYFRQAIKHLGLPAKVLAADLEPRLSSACQLADEALETPRIADPDYIERLLAICQMREVAIVVPTIDTDLLVLAQHRDRFAAVGTQVVVSDHALVARCRDKRLTAQLFGEYRIATAEEVDPHVPESYPLIARPYNGSSSKDIFVAHTIGELALQVQGAPAFVFNRYLDHSQHDEYTVDMYFDRQHRLKCLVPRLRVAVRAGEVSKAITCKAPWIAGLRERFDQLVGARGCLTMQLFVRRADQQIFGIEINPRFGGGYPLAYEAGANYPAWILSEYLRHETIDYFDNWESPLTMLRYDAHVLVRPAA